MSISLLTRKRLWAKAGNRCAICKIKLVSSEIKQSNDTNIGEECHIISEQQLGPRHKSSLKDYDSYDNLILLCRNHHKIVDTLIDTYTEEVLRFMKTNHEIKVDKVLENEFNSENKKEKPRFLKLITSGKDLINLARGAYASSVNYDENEDDDLNAIIAELVDGVIEYGEMDDFLTTSHVVEGAKYLNGLMKKIQEKGYAIYADKSVKSLTNAERTEKFNWPVFSIYVKKVE